MSHMKEISIRELHRRTGAWVRNARKYGLGNATVEDIFYVAPRTGTAVASLNILKASSSISIWPFYVLLAVMLLIVRVWVL